jgi:hypothetical protein
VERRSGAEASQANYWQGMGVGWEDVIWGRLRSGCQAGVVTAIAGPRLLDACEPAAVDVEVLVDRTAYRRHRRGMLLSLASKQS